MSTSVNKISSIIFPSPVMPVLNLMLSGYQGNILYQDVLSCYPWKNDISVYTNKITGYEAFNVSFIASSTPHSFLISSYYLTTDDYISPHYSDVNNISAFNNIGNLNNKFFYVYDSVSNEKAGDEFIPCCEIKYNNLYDFNTNTGTSRICSISSCANITVLERPPEARFFIKAKDNKHDRMLFFCNNTWGRACMESYTTTETRQITCDNGWGGYSTQTRSVTVVNNVLIDASEWVSLDNFCFPFLWAWNENGDAAFSEVINIDAAYSDTTVAYISNL